jgi:hypothetical protein
MTDFEDRLRSEVTSRTDAFAPSSDLPQRIGTRVRRHQRRRRLAGGVLSAGLAVAVVTGVVMARPSDDGADVVAGGSDSTTTTPSSAPSGSPPTSDTSATTGEPTVTTESTEPTSPPSSAATTTPTQATTTTASDLKPPDSQTPAAGVCAPATGQAVEVVINPDVPSPRCTQVTADQRLQVRNNTDQQVSVSFADFSATLAPGASQLFDRAFGDYLQPGVHGVDVSLYGGSGPEIWLTT